MFWINPTALGNALLQTEDRLDYDDDTTLYDDVRDSQSTETFRHFSR